MHEIRFVNEILGVLKRNLNKNFLSKPVSVNVRLSNLSHVSPKSLLETFNNFILNTEFKEVRLNIKPIEIEVICNECKKNFKVNSFLKECPYCKSTNLKFENYREFFVESIEIEEI